MCKIPSSASARTSSCEHKPQRQPAVAGERAWRKGSRARYRVVRVFPRPARRKGSSPRRTVRHGRSRVHNARILQRHPCQSLCRRAQQPHARGVLLWRTKTRQSPSSSSQFRIGGAGSLRRSCSRKPQALSTGAGCRGCRSVERMRSSEGAGAHLLQRRDRRHSHRPLVPRPISDFDRRVLVAMEMRAAKEFEAGSARDRVEGQPDGDDVLAFHMPVRDVLTQTQREPVRRG